MKWAALALGIVAAAILIALANAFLTATPPTTDPAPKTGMALIEAYACQPGETKRVTIRGVEDNFAPGNNEPATMHPRLRNARLMREAPPTNFDGTQPDHSVVDHFEFAPNTATAIVVVRAKPLGDDANDGINIGNLASRVFGAKQTDTPFRADRFGKMGGTGPWHRSGEIVWASIGNVELLTGETLLDLVRASGDSLIVDIEVTDDTAVDFMAVAACEHPPAPAGTTVLHVDWLARMNRALAFFDCKAMADCAPYIGNRPCTDELPLLCFADRHLPAPHIDLPDPSIVTRNWSGGEVAATPPVRAKSFRTIAEADARYANHFGKEWRVAEWHLAGRGHAFAAMTGGRKFAGEYWIDIRGAPYGACWKRNDDEK